MPLNPPVFKLHKCLHLFLYFQYLPGNNVIDDNLLASQGKLAST